MAVLSIVPNCSRMAALQLGMATARRPRLTRAGRGAYIRAHPRKSMRAHARSNSGVMRRWTTFKVPSPRRAAGKNRRRPPCWCWPTAPSSKASASAPRGSAVGEVCFNTAMTGYEEILTDPSYAGRSSPSPSRISAMSATNERGHRDRQPGGASRRARRRAACADHRAVQLPRDARSRRLAEGARHRRPRRHRHARADRADPRERHAQRRHRP